MRHWKTIDQAEKGMGPVLLRSGTGPLDGVCIGYQADDGRWMSENAEVHPVAWCRIPEFDLENEGSK